MPLPAQQQPLSREELIKGIQACSDPQSPSGIECRRRGEETQRMADERYRRDDEAFSIPVINQEISAEEIGDKNRIKYRVNEVSALQENHNTDEYQSRNESELQSRTQRRHEVFSTTQRTNDEQHRAEATRQQETAQQSSIASGNPNAMNAFVNTFVNGVVQMKQKSNSPPSYRTGHHCTPDMYGQCATK